MSRDPIPTTFHPLPDLCVLRLVGLGSSDAPAAQPKLPPSQNRWVRRI